MSAPKNEYKRSWKNLLINKRYQLQFTLFMVGLSTVLMTGLGVWVMRVANETTSVSMASVRGTPCAPVPALEETPAEGEQGMAPAGDEVTPPEITPPEITPPPAADGSAAPAAPAVTDVPVPVPVPDGDVPAAADPASPPPDEAAPPRRAVVQMQESSMTMVQVPPEFGAKVIGHWTCEMRLRGQLHDLARGRERILWVLIATGLLLTLGLAAYGIKMTHKVAGPLFKVSLYLAKMRDGRLDKVWNLRKGDQLVEFYDHFRTAHAGVVKLEHDDIAQVKAVIAAAEGAGAGDHAAVVELRELLARKEKAVE